MKRLALLLIACLLLVYACVYIISNKIPVFVESSQGDQFENECRQREADLFAFIEKKLLGTSGEIYTGISDSDEDRCVLAESVGLLMQYCVLRDRKDLFDKELDYLERNLLVSGKYIKWRTGALDSTCDAAVDDFRIIGALLDAYDKWKEKKYYNRAGALQHGMYEKLASEGSLHELYDWKQDKTGQAVPLCYIDLYNMDRLRIFNKNWQKVAARGEELLSEGRLDSPVSLFNKYYSYKDDRFIMDEEYSKTGGINMTYTLITLLNLAAVNNYSESFVTWLEYETRDGRFFAWYNPYELTPVSYMESTSVYALASMYAGKCGETRLSRRLLKSMNSFMVSDKDSEYYGGFGNRSSGKFYSFDNLSALLAYASYKE